jgi:DNA replication protein DnaC
MKNINESIMNLRKAGVETVRKAESYSFGNFETCKNALTECFLDTDKTIVSFQWLPEYNEIVEWMVDTKGKGLLLMGDCGRGKSSILRSVIPLLFEIYFNKNIKPISAKELSLPDPQRGKKTIGWHEIAKRWCYDIDELGKEDAESNYGERFEPFTKIIDEAENWIKLVFISTNLTKEQLLQRYGERSFDRLVRLCKVIEFKGCSFRE